MKLAAAWLVVGLTGCNSIFGLEQGTTEVADGDPSDEVGDDTDVEDDLTDEAQECAWGYLPRNFEPCALGTPTEPPSDETIDTDTFPEHVVTLPGGEEVVLLFVTHLDITSVTQVVGSRPLVLAVDGNVTIDSYVVVANERTGESCNAEPGIGVLFAEGGAGGGGGGGLVGGGGGGNGTHSDGGPGGSFAVGSTRLGGGCAGGDGAGVSNGGVALLGAGAGGRGGGALQISARGRVAINDTIDASGAGGGRGERVGSRGAGGGGGGGGGTLIIEGDEIRASSAQALCVDGGGGGSGGMPDPLPGEHGQSGCLGGAGGRGTTSSNATLATGGAGGRRSDNQLGQPADSAGTATGTTGYVGAGGGGGGAGQLITRPVL